MYTVYSENIFITYELSYLHTKKNKTLLFPVY